MIAYGIRVLPLIRDLRGAQPRVTQPWYAEDSGAGGKFPNIMEHLRDLQARVPAQGYYPDLIKSVLVLAPGNVDWAEDQFRGLGIKVVTGHRYLGGYIGDKEAEGMWLAENIKEWTELVEILAKVSQKHPKSAYANCRSHSNRSGHHSAMVR